MLDFEERIFTLSDVKRLYTGMRRRLLKWALIGAILAFGLTALKSPPKYKIEATFKEAADKSGAESLFKEMFGGIGSGNQPEAATIMKSYQVLKPLVEKMGLQASVGGDSRWIFAKVFKRLRENLQAEWGNPVADGDPFLFEDVVYEGNALDLQIRFTDATHFTLYSADRKKELATSVLGEKTELLDFQFTLIKTPKHLKTEKFYPLHIHSWIAIARQIRGDLQITSEKTNKSIYTLSFSSRDRHFATKLINELMNQYQIHLKKEHDQTAKEQLAYLEKKQEQIFSQVGNLFDEHAAYLAKNLKENGFIAVEEAGHKILAPHQEMQNKLISIDVELSHIDQIKNGGKAFTLAQSPIAQNLQNLHSEINDLKQQRDLLELSLCSIGDLSLEARKEDLKEIRSQRYAIEQLIQEVALGQKISSFDWNPTLSLWAAAVQDPEEKGDLAEYLENYNRLLFVREKMLQERFFYGTHENTELKGIDLLTARQLLVQYNGKLDETQSYMHHLAQFKKEMQQTGFELGSLSTFLKDPLSQRLIAEASNVALRLKDERYRSSKEGNRWEEELSLQKTILSDHLDQLYRVEDLNASLIREKIAALQALSIECMNQKISVLSEQTQDVLKERRQSLIQEKKVLENKMEEIRNKAEFLPEKWRLEKWLALKAGLVTNMMSTITEVVESKAITNQLHRIGSKPLDFATLPLIPNSPRLFVMAFLGAFISAFGLFFFHLIRHILKGFPISFEKLQVLRLPLLGSISSLCDGPLVEIPNGPDLELLRSLGLFAHHAKVIGLIAGSGPDYSFALAENLARTSIRSLILRCDFRAKFQQEDCPGLLQIWKEEITEFPIRKGKGFDYLTAGGYTPFGTEMIQSKNFGRWIEELKKSYDHILILSRAPLSSAESIALLRLCDKAAVTVGHEQIEELTPFIRWGYHEDQYRLTFITQA